MNRAIWTKIPKQCRFYSVKSNWSSINNKINKIGQENTKESQNALKTVRFLGGASVIAVLCSLLWNSQYIDQSPEQEVLQDLSKDVRNQ